MRGPNLTEQQAAAFGIAANRITELGGWDDVLLATNPFALDSDGFGLDGTGCCRMALISLSLHRGPIGKRYGSWDG